MLKGDKSPTNAAPTVFQHKNHITFKQTLNFISAINSSVFKIQKIQFLIVEEEVGVWMDDGGVVVVVEILLHPATTTFNKPFTCLVKFFAKSKNIKIIMISSEARQKCLN